MDKEGKDQILILLSKFHSWLNPFKKKRVPFLSYIPREQQEKLHKHKPIPSTPSLLKNLKYVVLITPCYAYCPPTCFTKFTVKYKMLNSFL
jgi:hypothetical protein